LCNYLHENSGERRVDHKRHQEQEGKQAERAQQDEKGCGVEESLLAEGRGLLSLPLHGGSSGPAVLVGRGHRRPYPFMSCAGKCDNRIGYKLSKHPCSLFNAKQPVS